METFEQKLVNELKAFQKAFKSTVGYQKYDVNVFDCLNKRYIEAGRLIDEYERRQKLKSENGKLPIPHVSNSSSKKCSKCGKETMLVHWCPFCDPDF